MINPMAYISYHEHGAQIVAGPTFSNVMLAVAVLAFMVVASWFAATYQWRRLQA